MRKELFIVVSVGLLLVGVGCIKNDSTNGDSTLETPVVLDSSARQQEEFNNAEFIDFINSEGFDVYKYESEIVEDEPEGISFAYTTDALGRIWANRDCQSFTNRESLACEVYDGGDRLVFVTYGRMPGEGHDYFDMNIDVVTNEGAINYSVISPEIKNEMAQIVDSALVEVPEYQDGVTTLGSPEHMRFKNIVSANIDSYFEGEQEEMIRAKSVLFQAVQILVSE